MLDVIGHIGYLIIFIGLILLGYKKRSGWLFRFVGDTVVIYLGIVLHLTSIWMWGIVFGVIDLTNFYKWTKTNVHIPHTK